MESLKLFSLKHMYVETTSNFLHITYRKVTELLKFFFNLARKIGTTLLYGLIDGGIKAWKYPVIIPLINQLAIKYGKDS